MTDEHYMKMALIEAEAAANINEIPIGAIIVCQNQIIAQAHNLTETLNHGTAHAEMQTITIASDYLGGKYLRNCSLYVTVEPCAMCAGAIGWAQIERVVYGTSDEKKGFSIIAPNALHPKCQVTKGVLQEECSTLMKDFFQKKR